MDRLSVRQNNLTGSIPPELGKLTNLGVIDLRANRLSGPIPQELGWLTNLQGLYLDDNELTGVIPRELGSLGSLKYLYLRRNHLSGSVPPQLGNLGNLEQLHLGDNRLSGRIPTEMGGLVNLRWVDLSRNHGLSGPLPGSLTNLRRLESFLTRDTQLCAPADEEFLDWLNGIRSQRVPRCVSSLGVAYLTQAVQSREFPVPLVAGEEALLRVFLTANRADNPGFPPVEATFFLSGRETFGMRIPGTTSPIPTKVDESSLARSANALIPPRVVQPGLEMVVEVDPDGDLDPALGVVKRIPETGRLSLDVRTMAAFDLTLVPFVWTDTPSWEIVEIVEDAAVDPQGHELLRETRMLLPVATMDVTAHDTVLTSTNHIVDLLAETHAIRAMEGGTGYYQGMMSGRTTGGATGLAAGRWVSFSKPLPGTVAHELGHNMRLGHAPCGGVGGVDPAFPRQDGAIGAWGYDFREGGRLVNPSTRDLMSYCGPQWISDYHFSKALRSRLEEQEEAGAATMMARTRSLLLWGGVDENGAPFLEPVFVVDAPSAMPDKGGGPYRLRGTADNGRQLFSFEFATHETVDGEGSELFAFVLPVEPGWAGALAGVTLFGPAGSVTLDVDSDKSMTILRDTRSGQVRGILRGVTTAAAVRALTRDHFGSIRGMDLLVSSGIPDAEAWRR